MCSGPGYCSRVRNTPPPANGPPLGSSSGGLLQPVVKRSPGRFDPGFLKVPPQGVLQAQEGDSGCGFEGAGAQKWLGKWPWTEDPPAHSIPCVCCVLTPGAGKFSQPDGQHLFGQLSIQDNAGLAFQGRGS